MARQPNPIIVHQHTQKVPVYDGLFGKPTGQFRLVKVPTYFRATKDPKKIARFKQIREWLDRAIAYGESDG